MNDMIVSLAPYSPGDEAVLRQLLTDPVIKQTFMVPDFDTEEALSSMVSKLFSMSRSRDHFERGIYLDGRLVGFVCDVTFEPPCAELGYALLPAYHGRGIATCALARSIAQLFADGFTRIEAGAFEDNPASLRVMEKCGMRPIPRREILSYRGRDRACVYRCIEKPGGVPDEMRRTEPNP